MWKLRISRMHFCWDGARGENVIFSGKDVDGEKVTEWSRMDVCRWMVPWINFTTSELHHFGFWSPDVTMITWCYYNDMNSPGNLLRSNWPPVSKITASRKVYPKLPQKFYPRILPTQNNDWSTNPPPYPPQKQWFNKAWLRETNG